MVRSLIFVLLLASLPRVVAATTIVAVPERELIARSDAIVVASVIRTWTVVDERGVVTTRASVQVYKAMRGAAVGDLLTLQVPGGKLHGMVAVTAGSPALQAGEMIFGFLQKAGEVHLPLGLSYGLLRVRSAADGTYRVFREVDGLNMVDRSGQPVAPVTVQLRDVPLDDLVARVTARLVELGLPGGEEVRP